MSEIEKIIYDETKVRIQKIEDKTYQFPKEINFIDWFIIMVLILLSLFMIILCQCGVIK